MKPATRASLLKLHTWIGLTAGFGLVVVALSGAAQLFRGPLERRLDPQLFVVTPGAARVSLDTIVEHARGAHPGVDVEKILVVRDPTAPALVLFSDSEYVHLNPYTGVVLGLRARYGDGFGWVDGLHRFLALEPRAGRIVTGSFAVGYVALALGGLALWFPTVRRGLKTAFMPNRNLPGHAWRLSLHRSLGALVALVILFNAATGVTIAFESARDGYYFLTGSTKDTPPTLADFDPKKFVGYQEIFQRVDALLPGAQEIYVLPPKRGVVMTGILAADAPHPNARSYAWFDAANGTTLRFTPLGQTSAGFRLFMWLESIHTGQTGGLPLKLVLFFACLSVPVLAYTGIGSFLRRRRPVVKTESVVPNPAHARLASASENLPD